MSESSKATSAEAKRRSFSLEVPNIEEGGEEQPPGTYLRLGTFDPKSPTDRAYFEGSDAAAAPPSIVMLTPGKLVQYAAATERVTMAREAIDVLVSETGKLINARHSHTDEVEKDIEREVAYRRSLSCEFEIGEKTAYAYAQAMEMKIGNGIDVKASAGLDVALGVQVGISRALKVEMGHEGIKVDGGHFGSYSNETEHTIEGENIVLRYSMAGASVRLLIPRLSACLQVITAAAAALMAASSATFPIGLSLQSREGDTRAATRAAVSVDNLRKWLAAMRGHQEGFTLLLVIAEAAGIALGIAALFLSRAVEQLPNPTQVKLDDDSVAIQSGGTFITVKKSGELQLSVAPPVSLVATSSIKMALDKITLGVGASSIEISATGVKIVGPQLTFGGAEVSVKAPVVQVEAAPPPLVPVVAVVDPLPNLAELPPLPPDDGDW